jgi:lysophospholipase L1-like esterase
MTTNDWANLTKYSAENKVLKANSSNEIVFIGDSITEFWKEKEALFFSKNNFINRGISGQTTPQMVHRFKQDVLDLNPKKVVILAGINDIAENAGPCTIESIMENIDAMVTAAHQHKISVVLCSVLPTKVFYWNPKLKPADKVIALNSLIEKYVVTNDIDYVDYYSKMVDDEKGLPKRYADDGVHPNLEGYQVMKEVLMLKLSYHNN